MRFINFTPFPSLAFLGSNQEGEDFQVVVLRQSFTFSTGQLLLAEVQTPLEEEDRFLGEPNRSSVLAESDLCPFKPLCDVILHATAHAPQGLPTPTFHARLQIQGKKTEHAGPILLDKTLEISGPAYFRLRHPFSRFIRWMLRIWTLGALDLEPWKRTRPEKIDSLPVIHEHAFGGEAKILASDPAAHRVKRKAWLPGADLDALRSDYDAQGHDGALAWESCATNPIGKGFAPAWYVKAKRLARVPAPQIQAPGEPLASAHFAKVLKGEIDPKNDPAWEPCCFGILPKAWSPRSGLLGTVDQAFRESGRGLPMGFDFAYWNAAPRDQQLASLKGDETLILTNLCRPGSPASREDARGNTVLKLDLPGTQPFLLLRYADGDLVPVKMDLDTLLVEPDKTGLVLVWRSAIPLQPAVRDLEARVLDREEVVQVEVLQGIPQGCAGPSSVRARLGGVSHG